MKAHMTDIWFRNAQSAMSICAEEGVSRLTWTRQHLTRLRYDGIMFVRQFYLHTPIRPKILLVGIQGSAEYGILDKLDKPRAVYPTWSGKNDTWDDLLDLIEKPWGEDEQKCSDKNIVPALRPVLGQKHRVVIHNCPSAISGVGKQFWAALSQVQDDYPDVELFINGIKSFSTLFGLRFKAGDYGISDLGDPNSDVILPNGMTVKLDRGEYKRLLQWEDWIKLLGFSIESLLENKNYERYRFRIRSVRWGAKHWADNYRFHRSNYNIAVDEEASDRDFVPPRSRRIVLRPRKFTTIDADKILCNRCRIAPGCKMYRQDSICGIKGSEMGDLEKFFQSRNASLIIDGLAQLTQLQARRVDAAIDKEADGGEVDPEVSKEIKLLFDQGVKLAKLVDPNLAGGPKVQVNVGVNGGNAEIVSMTNPKEVIAGISRQLQAAGIPLEQQTPEMLEGVLKGMSTGNQPQAIEAAVIKAEDIMARSQPKKEQPKEYVGEIVERDPMSITGRD